MKNGKSWRKIFFLFGAIYLILYITACSKSAEENWFFFNTVPTITSVAPSAGATGVDPSSSITVTFSTAMDKASAEGAFSTSPTATGSFTWNGNIMTFIPDASLSTDTEFTCTISTNAANLFGRPLESEFVWSFTTVDTVVPTITVTTPVNGTIGIAPSSTVTVTFSEPMDQTSVETAFSSNPALPTGTFGWAGDKMTYTPNTNLSESTDYEITLGTGATDLEGNPIASAFAFNFRTGLSLKVIDLISDYSSATGNSGVIPSRNGQYLYWWDGTLAENTHLYRVKISDLSSQTLWTDRGVWGIFDDGLETWVGNYYPSWATRITYSDPITLIARGIHYHSIGLGGNDLDFPYVYFGNSTGEGVGYWNKTDNATGIVSGTSGAYIYQSAVIGNKIYFPRGAYSPWGIMVVDAVSNPTALETTLLSGDSRVASAHDIYTDGAYLYVHNYATNEIQKIEPSTGSIVATFSPGVALANAAIRGNYIYAGVNGSKNVYIIDKNTGSVVVKDCSAYLTTTVGAPKWDFYNEGIWYGPRTDIQTTERKAYFIPKSLIDDLP